MYGNLLKTFFVSFLWLLLLFAAPKAFAVPKAIQAAQNAANQAGTAEIAKYNANISTQNEKINSYLKGEGKTDATAQQQLNELQAKGGATASNSASTLSTNQNSAATNWNQQTGTSTGTSGGMNSSITTSTSASSSSQRDLLNRQVPKNKDEATRVAMDCAMEFTQSVDAMTKNNVIGGVPAVVNQYMANQQTMTAAQLCSQLLSQFNLTRQAQVVMAAASGQLPPAGSNAQAGQGFTPPPDFNAFPSQLNTNLQALYRQQDDVQAPAAQAAEEAKKQKEQQAWMYMLLKGFGGDSASGEVDQVLVNLLFQ